MGEGFHILKLEHIGIAVRSIAEQGRVWQTMLGLNMEGIKELPEQKIKVAIFRIGELHIELIEPMDESSPVYHFIEKRGGGLHHLCFEVDDIETALAHLKRGGAHLIDERPRPGAWAKKIAFIHPRSMGGVLIELCEH
ncbi:methylmalonyl-CoA epimerase [candidate division WOR-3 bacterium 4484_100]|uniref:Methylmalonyl-CoA epimerase n=1 Tax=candidate division WOR-3 bacterium 4484_100 TaxID=1936077 RepID=A0A1V4QG19_UNCW3|nr:MAG: methylmalonyl-CoA epimerase [candidate division WOR-3 bacterium 4484_100]